MVTEAPTRHITRQEPPQKSLPRELPEYSNQCDVPSAGETVLVGGVEATVVHSQDLGFLSGLPDARVMIMPSIVNFEPVPARVVPNDEIQALIDENKRRRFGGDSS